MICARVTRSWCACALVGVTCTAAARAVSPRSASGAASWCPDLVAHYCFDQQSAADCHHTTDTTLIGIWEGTAAYSNLGKACLLQLSRRRRRRHRRRRRRHRAVVVAAATRLSACKLCLTTPLSRVQKQKTQTLLLTISRHNLTADRESA